MQLLTGSCPDERRGVTTAVASRFPGEIGRAERPRVWMLGGDHLLGVGGSCVGLLAADAFDLGDGLRGHDDATPAAA